MVAELRPRAASPSRDPLVAEAPLLPRYRGSLPPRPSSRWSLRRLMLLGLALYASLVVLWCVHINSRDGNRVDEPPGYFISAADLDDAKTEFLHAHEDRELRTEFPFAELEMEFLHQNLSVERDEHAIAEAEAHAKTLKPYPVSEGEIRR
nr:hypothetical protein PF009_g7081 [Phytophthora fragariae]